MLTNYLKIAWRQLWRERQTTTVSIVGLALGLMISLLIGLFVLHEWSYDRFHTEADRIYRLHTRMQYPGFEVYSDKASPRVGPDVQKQLPGVIKYVRFFRDPDALFELNPKIKFAEKNFALTDASFFDVFDFKLLKGNPKTVFQNPQSMVISQRLARRLFGNQDPVGQVLHYKVKLPFVITGVMTNPPSNSTLQQDLLAPISAFPAVEQLRSSMIKRANGTTELDEKNYSRGRFETYFLVRDTHTANQIPGLLHQLALESGENGKHTDLFTFYVQPLSAIHFNTTLGDTSNTRLASMFGMAALLVLISALVNYVSLTTARSARRGREVAVRKVAGASRLALIGQFYLESTFITFISFGLALCSFFSIKPLFENIIQIQISDTFIYQPAFLGVAVGLLFFTIAVSGSYPALLLSAFSPAETLRGKLSLGAGSGRIRNVFTVLQFGASVGLMSCGFIIYLQLQLVRTKDIGLDKAQIMAVPFSASMSTKVGVLQKQLGELPGVSAVTAADLTLFRNKPMTNAFASPVNGRELTMNIINAEANFPDFFGLRWAISPPATNRLGSPNTMILNETAAKSAGIYDIGGQWPLFGQPIDVLGITEDFNIASLRDRVEPTMLFLSRDSTNNIYNLRGGSLYLKLVGGSNWRSTIEQIGMIYQNHTTDRAFSYYFLDEAFQNYHKSESKMASLFGVFTVIALLIACMGLFGLVTFMVENRAKEIGIRKVLGASITNIFVLLSKDFLLLVFIATVLATPIAWLVMDKWLQDFAYKIDIAWWYFALAGLLAVGIALLTVSFQSIRAALMNPVKSLRSE